MVFPRHYRHSRNHHIIPATITSFQSPITSFPRRRESPVLRPTTYPPHHVIPIAHHAVSRNHHIIPTPITPFPQPSRRVPPPSRHSRVGGNLTAYVRRRILRAATNQTEPPSALIGLPYSSIVEPCGYGLGRMSLVIAQSG